MVENEVSLIGEQNVIHDLRDKSGRFISIVKLEPNLHRGMDLWKLKVGELLIMDDKDRETNFRNAAYALAKYKRRYAVLSTDIGIVAVRCK